MKYFLSIITLLSFLINQTLASDHYIIRQTPTITSPNFVLMDASSGLVLAERCAECKVQPASLTKLMPLFILSGRIRQREYIARRYGSNFNRSFKGKWLKNVY